MDPGAFVGPTCLQFLSLEENAIRSVDGLAGIQTLQIVRLAFNRLADTARVEAMSGLTRLAEVTLNNNPLARKPMYRASVLKRLAGLRVLDGREVTQEEREQVGVAPVYFEGRVAL